MPRRSKLVAQPCWCSSLAARALAYALSIPIPIADAAIPAHTPDVANGQVLFNAAGCLSCHKPGPDLKDVDASSPRAAPPSRRPSAPSTRPT